MSKGRQHGLVVIDKPAGMTSFDVVSGVRRALHERRVGHTGTLDPLATGVLPICVGEATKLVQFLTEQDKGYDVVARFGVTTTTLDAEGDIVRTLDAAHLSEQQVRAATHAFCGDLLQSPPQFSAIRVNGKRLYEHARAGSDVEIAWRPVLVHSFALQEWNAKSPHPEACFSIACGKGTYVRSLVHDLGNALGVGAHVIALRRTRAGAFDLSQAVSLDDFSKRPQLMTIGQVARLFPVVSIEQSEAMMIRQGRQSALPAWAGPPGYVAIVGPKDDLVAMARAEGQMETPGPGRPFSLTLTRVFG